MKNKKILFFALLLSQILIVESPQKSYGLSTMSEQNIKSVSNMRVDLIDWEYKTINGILYRRLYNFTTNNPLSNWERVQ
ncbi:MAG: hypothetical protein ACI4DX_04860 [Oliverpabstia sp.]|nr:hypothetical protein [Eubacterium sp.]MDY2593547.1 hypothetical protein [Oliverpabstia sp.]